MEFIIDRSKWRAGSDGKSPIGLGVTMMANDEGFMCCLGHCEKQLRKWKTDKKLLGRFNPIGLPPKNDDPFQFIDGKYYRNSELSKKAVGINDDPHLTNRERENALKALFKEHGHSIKFVGRSVKYK